jgi:hypothetical protein
MKPKLPYHVHSAHKRSKGQVFIIVAAAFLVLVAFVGLAVDVGLAFIAYGKLARSVDAAALAAAAQFREGRSISEMQATAENSMTVNGVNFTDIEIETCDWNAPPEAQDPQLCTQPYHKKLVRITVAADLPLAFMRVLGFDSVNLSASAISEAASMDVVLVLDISESMAWDAPSGDPLRNPAICNDTSLYTGAEDSGEYPNFPGGFPGECHPFEEVKHSASEFVLRVLDKPADEEEDRLAVVTFGNGWSNDPNMGTFVRTADWSNNVTDTLAIIQDLKIVEPNPCLYDYDPYDIRTEWGPCIFYDPPDSMNAWDSLYCISCGYPSPPELSYKNTTNIGGGLLRAGNMFGTDTREDSLWVVILLTDGMANTTDRSAEDDIYDITTYPVGHCPSDWNGSGYDWPLCQDENVFTRHDDDDVANYDADDYARDMADFVGCYPANQAAACGDQQGQGAVIFTIGLGDGVTDYNDGTTYEVNGLPYGVSLLRYIADVGDDGDSESVPDFCDGLWEDQTDWETWCGNYYFSPEGSDLVAVFQDIASRVFTRLAR